MNLDDLKLEAIGLEKERFGRIFTFIDFGNVNKWFSKDIWGWGDYKLKVDEKLIIDIEKMYHFVSLFSQKQFFYYGFDQRRGKESSMHMMIAAKRHGFKVITKPIQWIKHHLSLEEKSIYQNPLLKEQIKEDESGSYISIPKCNFDVEMC
jgi:hypothetical protein